jgi:nucleotide-binding universal stress UspA family protein
MLHPEPAAQEELDRLEVPGAEQVRQVVREVQSGPPFVEIVRYAKEHDVDLIVMGTHGRTGIAHALIGSVAEKVVRKAPCPVLTVRPEGHQFVMP